MQTGLFFGSFNPIHNGHLAIAGYMLEYTNLNEVWFVVSPHNPLKESHELAADTHRLAMVKLAVEDFEPQISVCDIEMSMPRPSYTIDTLNALGSKYPQRKFTVLMGADSLESIKKWKDYNNIITNYKIMVYPRIGSNIDLKIAKNNIDIVNAPIVELSSTFIRQTIAQGRRADYFMPPKAYQYLMENNIY